MWRKLSLRDMVKILTKLHKSKEESFIAGYLLACGFTRCVIDVMDQDLKMIERSKELLRLAQEDLDVFREILERRIKEANKLLSQLKGDTSCT